MLFNRLSKQHGGEKGARLNLEFYTVKILAASISHNLYSFIDEEEYHAPGVDTNKFGGKISDMINGKGNGYEDDGVPGALAFRGCGPAGGEGVI